MIAVEPSSESWVKAATGDLTTLLLDHAHCEKKAASTAIRFLFKYPDWSALVLAMSRLAREELVHFERVLRELEHRGVTFGPLHSANYAAELFKACRGHGPREARSLRLGCAEENAPVIDEMLACALIEARSHERFERLAEVVPDARLATFYRDLAEAEARHGSLYVELAEEAAGGPVDARLAELVAHEARVVARPNQALRMHAGG
jgi:tRNA-(ms[2]io[6]A)-hydroxylase